MAGPEDGKEGQTICVEMVIVVNIFASAGEGVAAVGTLKLQRWSVYRTGTAVTNFQRRSCLPVTVEHDPGQDKTSPTPSHFRI